MNVDIENCVKKVDEFGEILLKFKRKLVKYPQRKFMKLPVVKMRNLLITNMKKVHLKLRILFTKRLTVKIVERILRI